MTRYHFPLSLVVPRVPSFLFGYRRSISADATAAFRAIGAAPQVSGVEWIPPDEGFLLVMNHYHRADIPSWWMALAAIESIGDKRAPYAPKDVRMVVASQWTYAGQWKRLIAEPFSRFLVGRIIHAYNFLPMIPPELGQTAVGQRAHSMRVILEAARGAIRDRTPIGLAPEGADTPQGIMVCPPSGAGRFMELLAVTGLPFLPAGAWADGDQIQVRFGKSFHLDGLRDVKKSEREHATVQQVMGRIAALVPSELRGPFGHTA